MQGVPTSQNKVVGMRGVKKMRGNPAQYHGT